MGRGAARLAGRKRVAIDPSSDDDRGAIATVARRAHTPPGRLHAAARPPRRIVGARLVARTGLVVLGYVAATVALTWPLAPLARTHLADTAGGFAADLHYLGWALAWQAHALLTDPARFVDGNIYGGAPRALFYGTPGFGLLPLFAPVFAATGDTTLVLDVALLASLALTAASIHLVVLAWT